MTLPVIVSSGIYLSKVDKRLLPDMEYIYPMRNTTTMVPSTDEIIQTSSVLSPL